MKFVLPSLLLVSCLGQAYATTSCVQAIDEKVASLNNKTTLIKYDPERTKMGKVARILGATAVGVTAGGAVGFILPYAITGATYAAMGVATGVAAAAVHAPGTLVLGGGGFLISRKLNDPDARDGVGFLGPVAGVATDLGYYSKGQNTGNYSGKYYDGSVRAPIVQNVASNLFQAASNVGSTLIPLATSHFVPFTALAGGLAGLGIAIKDTIRNDRYHNYMKAKELFYHADLHLKNRNLKFEVMYNELLNNKLKKKYITPTMLAKTLVDVSQNGYLCPLNYKKLKKLLATLEPESQDFQHTLSIIEEDDDQKVELAQEISNELESQGLNSDSKELALIIPLDSSDIEI